MFTPRGPVAGSFQHRLWPCRKVLEAATLLSRAFAFVLSWYKVIIALSMCLSLGALHNTVHTSIIAAKIVSLTYFVKPLYFGPDLNKNSNTNPVSTKCRLQTADCRPDTKCRLGTNCRLQTRCKTQTENLYCCFVWYVITCHLTTDRVSRIRFSPIILHDYLHYCGIFLTRFLITNVISSFHIVFSLCAWVGRCDVCTEFTNLMKVDVDVKEMPPSNIWHVQYSRKNCQLCKCSIRFTFLPDMSSFRLDLFSTFRGVHTLIFTCVIY